MPEKQFILATYLLYLFISLYITYFVGKTLYTNGEVYLKAIFKGQTQVVGPINRILLTGYYLLNAGFVLLTMMTQQEIISLRDSIELLAAKIGFVLLTIGVIHHFNVISLWFLSKRNLWDKQIVKP